MSEVKKQIAGIVAKQNDARGEELTKQLIAWLNERGLDYRIDDTTTGELAEQCRDKLLPREKFTTTCNPVVVLGGDGTLISASHHPADPPTTIVGVNIGTLGFLTEITTDELFDELELVLKGEATLVERSLLQVDVGREGESFITYHAINDVVISKEALARIFAIEFSVDGRLAAQMRGDGVIVASPSGSTAYSLSAGGSIVHPQVDAMLVTPICPHSLTSRPLVLPGSRTVSLKLPDADAGKNEAIYLTIDGQEGMALQAGDEISVTTSNFKVQFAKSSARNYFEILGTKLKWANQ